MNVMLASMLQRGSQEVEVKGKASEQDANSQEGETGFRVLMAELTHQAISLLKSKSIQMLHQTWGLVSLRNLLSLNKMLHHQ